VPIKQAFTEFYQRAPEGVWHAPGRVNLIGEHTDYGLTPTHLDWHCLADGGRDDIFDLTVALAGEYGLAARVWLEPGRQKSQQRGLPVVDHDFLDSFSLDLDIRHHPSEPSSPLRAENATMAAAKTQEPGTPLRPPTMTGRPTKLLSDGVREQLLEGSGPARSSPAPAGVSRIPV
jgi:hypothetical protein